MAAKLSITALAAALALSALWAIAILVTKPPAEARWIDALFEKKESEHAASALATRPSLPSSTSFCNRSAKPDPGRLRHVLRSRLCSAHEPEPRIAPGLRARASPAHDVASWRPCDTCGTERAKSSTLPGRDGFRSRRRNGRHGGCCGSRAASACRRGPPIAIWPLATSPAPKAIAAFSEWSRKNHVNVLAVWPPRVENVVYATPEFIRFFESIRSLYEQLGIRVLGSPQEYFLPADDMLDTNYHATLDGQRVVSHRLASDLCEIMMCPKRAVR